MEQVLERAKKVAEKAEVFIVSSKDTPVGFEANRLKMLETSESTSVCLRIVKDGKIGFRTIRPNEYQVLAYIACLSCPR